LKICEQHIDSIGLQLFFLVAMATKEKPSFATETTMQAGRSLSKIPFNFKQLLINKICYYVGTDA
jgi:hypothetical protein